MELPHVKWMNAFPVGAKLKTSVQCFEKTTNGYWERIEQVNGIGIGVQYPARAFGPELMDPIIWEVILPFKKVFVNETEY